MQKGMSSLPRGCNVDWRLSVSSLQGNARPILIPICHYFRLTFRQAAVVSTPSPNFATSTLKPGPRLGFEQVCDESETSLIVFLLLTTLSVDLVVDVQGL